MWGWNKNSKCHFDEQRWIKERVRKNLIRNTGVIGLAYKISPRTSSK
jgi:hypothetical protein